MDTPLVKRAYNLGLKVVPNFLSLNEDQIAYYEQHLDELPIAVKRGFTLPVQSQEVQAPVIVVSTSMYKTADTDLARWLPKTHEFTKKYFGVEVDFSKFDIPEELPWKNVLPVFDPGGLTNRQALKKLKKALGPNEPYEEVDVMQYSGSEASLGPVLHLIERSIRPNDNTMNMSPNELVATRKNWLRLRGYALGTSFHHFIAEEFLDPQTWTWFPCDRLPSDEVSLGSWDPDSRQVRFSWDGAGDRDPGMGARLAVSVNLKP